MFIKLEKLFVPGICFLTSYILFFILVGFQFYNPFATINGISWVGGTAIVLYFIFFSNEYK
ncbi:hypothetical protein CBLAS_1041 [Campylobacter blaseri]|uniref:Uncharacterized protein n=1 Tax=Campylobacter blaseri TaxID=2042961 RepID=A0A2P8QYI4_9BACT|nr:hypothetical protein CQ405_08740 [Campylobacter blaseri]PSM52451.1 hypothetical protein CRN67_08745 [Campylobacter blaseri]QKF86219.1 hypothetical protein CBLAS_1041 [Campylobacter blaseri]